MLFVDWRGLGIFLLFLVMLGLCFTAIWKTGKKSMVIRGFTALLTAPLIGIAGLGVLLILARNLSGCATYGQPVYSPNRDWAARSENFDAGATGGSTVVIVYGSHGFQTSTVFRGGWMSVENGDLGWASDSDLVIRFDHWQGYDEMRTCSSFGKVRVHCIAKPEVKAPK